MLNQEQQIFDQIKKANTILVTFSRSSGGDAVAAGLAIYLFLKKLGKKVDIVTEGNGHPAAREVIAATAPVAEKAEPATSKTTIKEKYLSFLPGRNEIKHQLDNLRKFIISLDIRHTKVGQIQYKVEADTLDFIVSPLDGFFTTEDITSKSSGFKYDLIITISTRDLESLGQIYDHDTEFFYQTTIINIDNQPANESYGQINLIDLNTVSSTEILFNLFNSYDRSLIDDDIATCLLAGMIIATKSFKTNNISPQALGTASQLIAMGARREEIVNHLYRSRSLNLLKLWGIVLARLSSTLDSRIISSIINLDDFQKTKTETKDLYDVIDELIVNIPQAKIIVLMYELIAGGIKQVEVMIYGVKNLDVASLVSELNPIGNKSLVRIKSLKPIKEFEKEIITLLSEKAKRIEL
jgi:nanoRNase/pAp phosphatase (c-di-AMP/oligoRNAs hydrolase)